MGKKVASPKDTGAKNRKGSGLRTTSVLRSLPPPSAGDVEQMARRLQKDAKADKFESLMDFQSPVGKAGQCLVPDWDEDNQDQCAKLSMKASIGAIKTALETGVVWLPYQVYDEQRAASRYLVYFRSGEFSGGRIFVDEIQSLNLFELAGQNSIDLTIFKITGSHLTKSEMARIKAEIRADFLADLDPEEVTFRFTNPEPVYIEAEVRVRY